MNVNGLQPNKLSVVLSWLTSDVCDIVFLSETWFIKHQELCSLPLFLCHTPLINPRTTGHQNGGVVCLVAPSIKPHMTITHISEFFIAVRFRSLNVTATYLPPRLEDDTVFQLLQDLPPTDSLIGDINIRLGTLTRSVL